MGKKYFPSPPKGTLYAPLLAMSAASSGPTTRQTSTRSSFFDFATALLTSLASRSTPFASLLAVARVPRGVMAAMESVSLET